MGTRVQCLEALNLNILTWLERFADAPGSLCAVPPHISWLRRGSRRAVDDIKERYGISSQ